MEQKQVLFFQDQVDYTTQSEGFNICGNCRWFDNTVPLMPCVLVMNEPLPIVASGWCKRHESLVHLDTPQANDVVASLVEPDIELENSQDVKATFSGSAFLLPVDDNVYFDRVSRLLFEQYGDAIELTSLGGYHITLAYMPDSDPFIPNINTLPFRVRLNSLVVWDDNGDGYPLVLILEKTPELVELQASLYQQALDITGMPLSPYSEPANWQPHITLGYFKSAVKPAPDLFVPELEFNIYGVDISDRDGNIQFVPFNEPELVNIKNKKSLFINIAEKVLDFINPFNVEFDTPTGFKVYKDNYWIAWYSNSYLDRDKEYFASKGIERDIEYMQASGDYPELWRWHIGDIENGLNPTRHGKAFYVDMMGKFAVAIGKFDDTPIAQKFKAYYKEHPDQALSHGFFIHKKEGDTYTDYHTFEISTLPAEVAANPYTTFLEFSEKEHSMKPNERALADLKSAVGDDEAAKILAALTKAGLKATAVMDNQGVAFKAAKPPMEDDMEEDMEDDTEGETAKKKPPKKEVATPDLAPLITAMNTIADSVKALGEQVQSQGQELQSMKQAQAQKQTEQEQQQTVLFDQRKQALVQDLQNNMQGEKNHQVWELPPAEGLISSFGLFSKPK